MNINIDLEDEHIKYLKWFKTQHRPEMKGYHPIVWDLEYIGILLTTNLDEDGKQTDKIFILPSGIGKEIIKKL